RGRSPSGGRGHQARAESVPDRHWGDGAMSLDVHLYKDGQEVHWGNITHNLNTMANEAGIYPALWRPEEIGAVKASDIVDILRTGLHALVERPSYFKEFDAPN